MKAKENAGEGRSSAATTATTVKTVKTLKAVSGLSRTLILPGPRLPREATNGLGLRVRKARMALKLSLADVAGNDFSRSFLNQVELGRTRPSTRTLEIIARRLHQPVDFFLQDPENSMTAIELAITESETRLKQGDAPQAKTMLTAFLARPHLTMDMRARARLLLGEAHLRLNGIPEGIATIEEALTASQANKWWPLVVEAQDLMGSAYYLLRRPSEAGRWFDTALATYEANKLRDPLLKARIQGHRANLHYVSGQPRDAIAAYQAAIVSAGRVMDMKVLGGIYEGLAMSYQRTGDLSRALTYAQRSLRLFETLQDVRMASRLRNNMAEILLEQDRPKDAEALYTEGANDLAQVGDTDLRPHLLAGAAEAALDQGQLDRAREEIAIALTAADQSKDPLARLAAHRIAGRVAQSWADWTECQSHFEAALQIARAVDSPMERSKVAYDYAQALAEQGDSARAILHYREAYTSRQVYEGA